jgi:hypothetical protein
MGAIGLAVGATLALPALSPATATRADAAAPAAAKASQPGHLLDLTNWKLTLPVDTGRAGSPDEVRQPELAAFLQAPYVGLSAGRDAVLFRAHAGGKTTGGSSYPRSELREMTQNGTQNASWSTTSGTHTMEVRQAVTHLPVVKPHVTTAQIHDSKDDVVVVRLEGKRLFAEHNGQNLADLDTDYTLGEVFTVKFVASGGRIKLYHNGVLKLDQAASTTGNYFKAGAYTQSNTSKGESPSAFGEVAIYDLKVTHTQ